MDETTKLGPELNWGEFTKELNESTARIKELSKLLPKPEKSATLSVSQKRSLNSLHEYCLNIAENLFKAKSHGPKIEFRKSLNRYGPKGVKAAGVYSSTKQHVLLKEYYGRRVVSSFYKTQSNKLQGYGTAFVDEAHYLEAWKVYFHELIHSLGQEQYKHFAKDMAVYSKVSYSKVITEGLTELAAITFLYSFLEKVGMDFRGSLTLQEASYYTEALILDKLLKQYVTPKEYEKVVKRMVAAGSVDAPLAVLSNIIITKTWKRPNSEAAKAEYQAEVTKLLKKHFNRVEHTKVHSKRVSKNKFAQALVRELVKDISISKIIVSTKEGKNKKLKVTQEVA